MIKAANQVRISVVFPSVASGGAICENGSSAVNSDGTKGGRLLLNMLELPEVPEGFRDLLELPITVTLATIMPDGSPHLSLIWRIWEPPYILMGTDPNSRKARNVLKNPQIAIMAVDPKNDHRYITSYGMATLEHTPDGGIYDRIGLLYRSKITYGGREVPEEDREMLYTIRAKVVRFSTFLATREAP